MNRTDWVTEVMSSFPACPSAVFSGSVQQGRARLRQPGDGHEALLQGGGAGVSQEPAGGALRDGEHLPLDVSHPGHRAGGQRRRPERRQTHAGDEWGDDSRDDSGWVCVWLMSLSTWPLESVSLQHLLLHYEAIHPSFPSSHMFLQLQLESRSGTAHGMVVKILRMCKDLVPGVWR